MTKHLLCLIPYLAVLVGLYWFDSAWPAMLIYHALMLAVLARKRQRARFRQVLAGWRRGAGAAAVAFGLGAGVLLFFLAPPAGLDVARLDPILARIGLSGSGFLAFAIYYSLVNPGLEEAFWRGALGSDARGVVAADVLFAGYHLLVLHFFVGWIWLPVALVVLTAAAWLWRQATARYGGLAIPVVSHLAADASLMVAVGLLLIGTGS